MLNTRMTFGAVCVKTLDTTIRMPNSSGEEVRRATSASATSITVAISIVIIISILLLTLGLMGSSVI